MSSIALLTFSNSTDVTIDEYIDVNINIGGGSLAALRNTFKATRNNIYQSAITDPYNSTTAAVNFVQAFNADLYTRLPNNSISATNVDNVVTLTMNNSSWIFAIPTGTAITSTSIGYSNTNDPVVDSDTAKITSYSEKSDNRCTKAEANILVKGGSGTYDVYVNNVLTATNETPATDATFAVLIDRGISQVLRVVDSNGLNIATIETVNTRKLIANDITVKVENYASGATLRVSENFIQSAISVTTYSLDGITYQTSSVFTGQAVATYTLYVKDGFGCITIKQVVVDGVTTVSETVFSISAINALRFALVDDVKKNQLNTLSFNELRITKYPYYQQYLENEVITTQFKTNAQYLNCVSLDKNGATTTLTPVKKTLNIGLKAKRTSTYFDLGNNRSGIYFGVVDSLDFITEAVIEELNYGFALPEWANKEGDLVTIDGIGQVPIDAKGFSETYNSFILEFDIAYTGSPITDKIISAEYNLQPYEIYEIQNTVTEDSNIVIQAGVASDNLNFTYVSEGIRMVADSEFLFDITYWDDENKGSMNYQTGIKHKLRLNGYQESVGEQETAGYNGDTGYFVTDNVVYDMQSFKWERLSSELAQKLRLVVTHKYLQINGLFYKLADVPELAGDMNFNMKTFSVSLKQGGDLFLTAEQENITNTSISGELLMALASAQGKGVLSWSKNY
jgi:hypothetical protein